MRYIKSLERKDLALNYSMISLGSCTMKLNAAAGNAPLSDSQLGKHTPLFRAEQAKGYHEMLEKLTEQLNVVTDFAATSLQPNSGAQGEYSGLMVIRAYHKSRNDSHRNICIIPFSAHGTNPAQRHGRNESGRTATDEKATLTQDDLHQKAMETQRQSCRIDDYLSEYSWCI